MPHVSLRVPFLLLYIEKNLKLLFYARPSVSGDVITDTKDAMGKKL